MQALVEHRERVDHREAGICGRLWSTASAWVIARPAYAAVLGKESP
jgi:hypothetical protein